MVGGRRRGAGRRPGMSSDAPPGVAGRLHQTPRGAAAARAAGRADPSRPAGRLGQAGSPPAGPAPMRAAGSAAASSFSLSSPAASLPAPPARPPPGGLHSERPRTRGPTRPRPLSLRVSEEERRLRNRQPPPVPPPPPPRLPLLAGAARATAAATTNGGAGLQVTRPPLVTGRADSQSLMSGCGRRARGEGVGCGAAGLAGVAEADCLAAPPAQSGGEELRAAFREKASVEVGEAFVKAISVFGKQNVLR